MMAPKTMVSRPATDRHFPQALPDRTIHHNPSFIEGMALVISVSAGSADTSIVGASALVSMGPPPTPRED
jgi:hypothetical protein